LTQVNRRFCIRRIVFRVKLGITLDRLAGTCAAAALAALAVLAPAALAQDEKDAFGAGHVDTESRDLAASPGTVASATVTAAEERWQSSGAQLRQGSSYKVTASGEWKLGVLCTSGGPGGVGSSCFPFPSTLLKSVPINTLIGKIGKKGAPFPIGEQLEFTAQADGVLYLRHNDGPSFANDNFGFVNVQVRLAGTEAAPAAAPPTAAPPAAAKRPVQASRAAAPGEKDALGVGHADIESRDLAASPETEISSVVMAAEERWQSSGVLLREGGTYKITASGSWRHGLLCAPSGPSGVGSTCFPFPATLLRGIALGTLIGKVGASGAPFPIGDQREFTAQSDGVLYLRHNDNAGMAFDNTGYVNVKVRLAGAAPAPVAATQAAPAQRPAQAPMPPAAPPAAAASVQYWAVVVGVSEYADTGIPSLRYATADARAMYDWLVSPNGGRYAPSRVKLLLDREATAVNIRDALFNWLRQAIEEDVVLIYFAGHGSPDSPDTPNNLYLVPYDARYQSIASTGFPMWDIETALKRFIKAKRVIVVADACHSGGVGEGFDIARRAIGGGQDNPITSGLQGLSAVGPGVVVLSASDQKQFSAEGTMFGGGHGAFTHYLLEGLRGQADYNQDGRVTLGELIPYLSENVRRATLSAQSPTVAGRFDPALSIGK
jgi:uncharacterized caspase-like protein